MFWMTVPIIRNEFSFHPAYQTVIHTQQQIPGVAYIQLFLMMMGTVARNIYRKEINILRKIVHQVGFIYKIIQGCTVNKTYNFAIHFVCDNTYFT
jgi:hypothetical protein